MRRFAILGALTALLALTAAPAAAQDYPPAAASCTVGTTTPAPGGTVAVDCGGWLPNSEVRVLLFSEPRLLGTAQVGSDGELHVDVTLPSGLTPGEHVLRFAGTSAEGEPQNIDLVLNVEGAAGAGADQPEAAAGLPVTGKDSVLFGVLALGLFGAGGGALFAARRRSAGLGDT